MSLSHRTPESRVTSTPPSPPATTTGKLRREVPGTDFVDLINAIENNAFATKCTEELQMLVREGSRIAEIPNTKPKGRITLTIDVAFLASGMTNVVAEVKVKTPKQPKSAHVFFRTKEDTLSPKHQQQIGIPFEDVSTPRPGTVEIVK